MDHGLELGDGAVGQGFPQIEDLDHCQAAQLQRRPGFPQLLSLTKHPTACVNQVIWSHCDMRAYGYMMDSLF